MIFPILSWQSSTYVEGTGEPEDYIYNYFGKIHHVTETERRILIGKFQAYYVDVGLAVDEGRSIFDVLDAYAQTFEYHDDLFGENAPQFSEKIEDALGYDIDGLNLFILDRLEILPKYRGTKVGLSVLSRLIKRFSAGAGVVAMKPFPLQLEKPSSDDDAWRNKLKLNEFSDEEDISKKKLVEYYSRLGFIQLPNSPYMVLGTASLLPNI